MRAKVPKTLMPILHWRKRIVQWMLNQGLYTTWWGSDCFESLWNKHCKFKYSCWFRCPKQQKTIPIDQYEDNEDDLGHDVEEYDEDLGHDDASSMLKKKKMKIIHKKRFLILLPFWVLPTLHQLNTIRHHCNTNVIVKRGIRITLGGYSIIGLLRIYPIFPLNHHKNYPKIVL